MRRILVVLAMAVAAGIGASVLAQTPGQSAGDSGDALFAAQQKFGVKGFTEPYWIARFGIVILGAIAVGAVLAWHPFRRRASVEDLEQPKIMVLYAVIGALVGIIVGPVPELGFAIFGIGGLMRFRTEIAAAKETGRVILVTILGIACGLEFWMAVVLATILAWILLYVLESSVSLRLVVRGVRTENLGAAAVAYAKVLRGLRCRFATPRKNANKGQISFVLHHHRGLKHEEIEATCNVNVPKDLRGTIDWPED